MEVCFRIVDDGMIRCHAAGGRVAACFPGVKYTRGTTSKCTCLHGSREHLVTRESHVMSRLPQKRESIVVLKEQLISREVLDAKWEGYRVALLERGSKVMDR